MSTLHILAIGTEADILAVVERLINSHEGWQAATAGSVAEAMTVFGQRSFRIVLVCAGITLEEETSLRQRMQAINPTVTVIRHFGGGSGLLENEINQILWTTK